MTSNAYRERLKSVAKDYAKLPHLKRQLNEKSVSSKINSIIYNDKKDFLIIEDSSSNNHVQILKASNNGAVDSWDGSGALEAVPGVTRSNYLNSTEVARFVSESDVKRAFGRKFKDIYKDTNLKVYGIRPGGMYSVGEDNIGRKVWCDVLISLKYAPNKKYPSKSALVYSGCHLIFTNSDEQTEIMNIANKFPSPYTSKNSFFVNGGCQISTAACKNHVDYLGTLYPTYYRRKLIEKRRTLYTMPNWEKTIVQFVVKASIKFDHYIEYPVLFDYDGNVRIPKFYFENTREENGENIVEYRASNF